MTDLIKRDDALTLVEQWFATDDYLYSTIINDITNLPAIDLASLAPTPVADSQPADPVVNDHIADAGKMVDPAAIREAALRDAAAICIGVSNDVWTQIGRGHAPYMKATAEDCSKMILALIGEKK